MRVLVACEFSQVVTKAFRDLGHDAYSCDILPTLGNEEWHHQRDVLEVIGYDWDLMIAHPPCTYLSNSGVRWLYLDKQKTRNEDRWDSMREGAEFFKALLNADIPRICVENPVVHGHAKTLIGQDFTQSVQPWQFGHGYTKRTCFWLKNLPTLRPTNVVEGREQLIHKMPPGKDRGLKRSVTPQGMADAMALQWGGLE